MRAAKLQSVIIILSASVLAVTLVIGTIYLVTSRSDRSTSTQDESVNPAENDSSESTDTLDTEYNNMLQALHSAVEDKQREPKDISNPSQDPEKGTQNALDHSPEWSAAIREISWSNSSELNSKSCDLLSGNFDLPQDTTAAVIEWSEQPPIESLSRDYRAYVFHSKENADGAELTDLQQLVYSLATSPPNCKQMESDTADIVIRSGPETKLGREGFLEAKWMISSSVDDPSFGSGPMYHIANNFVWNDDYAVYIQMFEAPHEERPYKTEETITEPWIEASLSDVPDTSKSILSALGAGEPAELPNIQPPPDEVPDEVPGDG